MDNTNIEQGQRIGNNTADIKVIYSILKSTNETLKELSVNCARDGKKIVETATGLTNLQKWVMAITMVLGTMVSTFMVGVIIYALKMIGTG